VAEEALRGLPVTEPAPERLPRPRGPLGLLRRSERGTALVEFALVAPVLFLLIFGVLDFSLALNDYNQASQLVGLGARAAAVNRCPSGGQIGGSNPTVYCGSIQSQLSQQYAHGALKGHPVCIAFGPSGAGAGQPVTVSVTYPAAEYDRANATLRPIACCRARYPGNPPRRRGLPGLHRAVPQAGLPPVQGRPGARHARGAGLRELR